MDGIVFVAGQGVQLGPRHRTVCRRRWQVFIRPQGSDPHVQTSNIPEREESDSSPPKAARIGTHGSDPETPFVAHVACDCRLECGAAEAELCVALKPPGHRERPRIAIWRTGKPVHR